MNRTLEIIGCIVLLIVILGVCYGWPILVSFGILQSPASKGKDRGSLAPYFWGLFALLCLFVGIITVYITHEFTWFLLLMLGVLFGLLGFIIGLIEYGNKINNFYSENESGFEMKTRWLDKDIQVKFEDIDGIETSMSTSCLWIHTKQGVCMEVVVDDYTPLLTTYIYRTLKQNPNAFSQVHASPYSFLMKEAMLTLESFKAHCKAEKTINKMDR